MTVRAGAGKARARARGPRALGFAAVCRLLAGRHLVRLVTLLALLTASVGMIGSHGARAMPGAAMEHGAAVHGAIDHDGAPASGHCADMQPGQHDHRGSADIDCMIACAGLPATLATHAVAPVIRALRPSLPLASPLHGLAPEADTPPPRSFGA